ncbi:MAG: alpha/beta hydrolase [Lachnospiraceae bacterium]|nr:alpha/beta hydrolase [Lachnospiraceae bacterium]
MASAQMEQLKQVMKQMMAIGFAPKFDGEIDPIQLRNVIQNAQAHMALEPGVTYESCTLAGIECECNMPENARDDAIIFYIHGGGLICGTAETSRGYAGMLAGESHFPVYTCTYRLAPEDPFPAGVDDCYAVYCELVKLYPGKPIFLIGESGGAYLSITTAMKARDEKNVLPAGIVPYSPPVDFSGKLDRNFPGNKDFTVTPDGLKWLRFYYCKEEEVTNPYVSPIYADLTGMPPMLLAWDESESLAVDSEALRHKAQAAGVEVVWKSYPDCFHAFATTGRGTPESYEIMKDTIAFFEKHI